MHKLLAACLLLVFSCFTYASQLSVNHSHTEQLLLDEEVAGIAGSNDQFGISISANQNFAAVGASKAKYMGVVYFYEYINNSWQLHSIIEAPDATPGSYFGYSVKLTDEMLFVGAYHDDTLTVSGSVYIYKMLEGNWQFIQKIKAPTPAYESHFGISLEAYSDYLFIGAPWENSFSAPKNDLGATYIYKLENNLFTLNQTLQPDFLEWESEFGSNIHASNDQVFIAAIGHNDVGSVFVYDLVNDHWQYNQSIAPVNVVGGSFGLTIKSNSDHLIIGSPYTRYESWTGKVYSYQKVENTWLLTQELVSNDIESGAWFGSALALNGNDLMIGANQDDTGYSQTGSVYHYQFTDNQWQEKTKLTPESDWSLERFGTSIYFNDESLLIGSYKKSHVAGQSGAVAHFVKQPNEWSQQNYLDTPLGNSYGYFGGALSLYNQQLCTMSKVDNDSNSVKLICFEQINDFQQTFSFTITGDLGNHYLRQDKFSIAHNDQHLLLGVKTADAEEAYDGRGVVFFFVNENKEWTYQGYFYSDDVSEKEFGKSISIENNRAVISSDRNAYLYDFLNGQWQKNHAFDNSPHHNNQFGQQVKIVNDTVVIAGSQYNTQSNELSDEIIFSYQFLENSWQLTNSVSRTDTPAYRLHCANTFDFDGVTLAVSCLADSNSNDDDHPGAVLVYKEDINNEWQLKKTLLPSKQHPRHQFAFSVKLTPDFIFVGAPSNLKLDQYYPESSVEIYANNEEQSWPKLMGLNSDLVNLYSTFGSSIQAEGNTVFVGALRAKKQGTSSGAIIQINLLDLDLIYYSGFETK
ncbi:FG-GAP repeat protein [Marinicella rhabdoformis]|uniref:FG-GAP repeat protein n=1 Tax=Marinicella rhabdoformis TaxID=2580566 RepID=UPI0012AEC312|nr:FG-GAP repeat protein [Marinicella rhabdoformis]